MPSDNWVRSMRVDRTTQRLAAQHPIHQTQATDQALQRLGVLGLHLEQHRVSAGHVVTLEHFVHVLQLGLEAVDGRSGVIEMPIKAVTSSPTRRESTSAQ